MKNKIFKISKDKDRAKDLFEISKDRLKILEIIPKDRFYKIIEEYYEIIKEMLTSVMYLDGYKTLSHIELIDYFSKNYEILTREQLKIVDILRKFRIGIVYYGKKGSEEFILNYEEEINKIIKMLIKLIEDKLKGDKQ